MFFDIINKPKLISVKRSLKYLSYTQKWLSFVGQRNLPRARAGFYSVYSQERYVEALEYVLNRLHRQDSFEQHFTRRVEEVIEDSERSHAENQVQPFQLNSEIEGIK